MENERNIHASQHINSELNKKKALERATNQQHETLECACFIPPIVIWGGIRWKSAKVNLLECSKQFVLGMEIKRSGNATACQHLVLH